jgi:hypothetical protein
MMENNIRKYIKIVESAYQLNEDIDTLIDQIFMESAGQLDEGILGDVKAKVSKWIDQAKDKTGDVLPALKKKYDEVIKKLNIQDAEKAHEVEAEMDKQAKGDWKDNAGKLVAALAVASTLLAAATPAQAGDRGYAYQVQRYNQQFQSPYYNPNADPQLTDYGKRQYNGPPPVYDGPRYDSGPYQARPGYYPPQNGEYPRQGRYYQQRGDAGDVAVGVLIGAALGAVIGHAVHR